jgi:EmrB/QacA subfamily drug resistance transporter
VEETELSQSRLNLITAGIMLSIFLASMEGTVVATAMPTIVGQLGGLSIYGWVFSVYMLTATTTVPIYGKLSDIYGRKQVYMVSMGLFLGGSVLCGQAQTMEQLILFRAVQGIGAGGVLPLAFTIIGELFSLEQRARLQGLFSGVWGLSSLIGPLIGGFLVDRVAWQWVFYINVVPVLLAVGLVWFAWQDAPARRELRPAIDYPGAAFLTLGVLALLLGLDRLGSPLSLGLIGASVGMFAGLYWAERRAADPILPLALFRERLFNVAILHGVLAGWAMFGSLSFVPLFVQAVLGTSATQAGIALTPMSLAWTVFSILSSRLLLKVGFRGLVVVGMALLVAGAFFMIFIGPQTNFFLLMFFLSLMGAGMGLSIPAFLIAVQSSVRRESLGVATATLQFSRSIGGTLGVSVMGVWLSSSLARRLTISGLDPSAVSLESLLDPLARAAAGFSAPVRDALSGSIASMFILAFAAALLGLIAVIFTPRGKVSQLERK